MEQSGMRGLPFLCTQFPFHRRLSLEKKQRGLFVQSDQICGNLAEQSFGLDSLAYPQAITRFEPYRSNPKIMKVHFTFQMQQN